MQGESTTDGRTRKSKLDETFAYNTLNRDVQATTITPGAGGAGDEDRHRRLRPQGQHHVEVRRCVYTDGTGFDVADACGGAGPHAVKAVAGA